MLKSVTYKNFKSFASAELQLNDLVSIIIGSNASGKSNAIEGLKFLSNIAKGYSIAGFKENKSADKHLNSFINDY